MRHGLRVFSLILLFAARALFAADVEPGICFLHLKAKDGTFTLISSETVPGTLKAKRAPEVQQPLLLAVENSAGETEWSESMADPLVKKIEAPVPDDPNQLQSKIIQLTEADIVLRVPGSASPRKLAIYQTTAAAKQAITPGVGAPARQLIVKLDLPPGTPR